MSNGLGINFFRYSVEEDTSKWCQIFAKLSFDDIELAQKGALFGVVRGDKNEGWSELDMEITAWVDEYFNGVESAGSMSSFMLEFYNKYPNIESVWMWVHGESERRKIKLAAKSGESFCKIVSNNNIVDLSKSLGSQKIVAGEINTGSRVVFGVGGLDDIENIDESIDRTKAAAFLRVVFEEVGAKTQEVEIKEVPLDIETEAKKLEPDLARSDYVVKPTFLQRISLRAKSRVGVEISSEESKKKRVRLVTLAGLFFVVLLVFSLLAGGVKKKREEEVASWLKFSEPIEKIVSEAVGISKINQQGAKQMLEEARGKYDSGKTQFDEERTASLSKKIEEAWTVVSGEVNSQLTPTLNLELIRAGFNAARTDGFGNSLAIISVENGVVMTADLESKAMKVVAGKGAGLGWIDTVSNSKNTYVLTKGGVFVAGNETNSLIFDSAVTDPVSLSLFGSNIYVLEKGNKEIYKYTISDSGFGERQRWLKEGQNIKSAPIDMDIDVDIWILTESGEVERFRRGIREAFNMTGVDSGIGLVKIAVDPNSDKIALLSVQNGSVYLCSKETGVCDKQLKNDRLSAARDVAFDEKGNLLVLFAGTVEVLN